MLFFPGSTTMEDRLACLTGAVLPAGAHRHDDVAVVLSSFFTKSTCIAAYHLICAAVVVLRVGGSGKLKGKARKNVVGAAVF